MNGYLIIDKPSGISSAQCVYQMRKILDQKKVGHCGTLDPLATGILPLCIGEATKFSGYISNQSKRYQVKILFGRETDTGDITGKEITNEKPNFSSIKLKNVLNSFIGDYSQLPPMYSALKLNGKPLYYWARKGVFLKRLPRKVSINNIELNFFDNFNKAIIQVSCSKGTYIRSLVESIGKKLKTCATVLELRRIGLGFLEEKHLIEMKTKEQKYFFNQISGCDYLLKNYPKFILNKSDSKKIRNGQQVDYNARLEKEGIVRLYEEEGSFIGIGSVDSSMKVSPKRLINTQKYSASPLKI